MYEFLISFYYRDGDTNRTVDYSTNPDPASFHQSLLVYTLHTARAIVNTAHSPHGQNLTRVLVDRDALTNTFVTDPYYQLTPFDGRADKMRIIVKARLEQGRTPFFNLKIKGFGLFGDKATIACVRSVGLHFNHLNIAYGPSSIEAEQLARAAVLCGNAALSGQLTIRSQTRIAEQIAAQAIQE